MSKREYRKAPHCGGVGIGKARAFGNKPKYMETVLLRIISEFSAFSPRNGFSARIPIFGEILLLQ
jgi:hypothetical protein